MILYDMFIFNNILMTNLLNFLYITDKTDTNEFEEIIVKDVLCPEVSNIN